MDVELFDLNELEVLEGGGDARAKLRVMTPQVVRTVDRAVRDGSAWDADDEGRVSYRDPVNNHVVELHGDELREAMIERVKKLNPRVADVWRLITAEILEHWSEAGDPPAVWVSVSDLLRAMGYKKGTAGGYKTRDVESVAEALGTLESLWAVIPAGSVLASSDPETGEIKPTLLTADIGYRVLVTTARKTIRTISKRDFPMQWQVRAGDWIRHYPREVATILKALVELPASRATDKWAKAIGMEIGYLYSRHRSSQQSARVGKLLERAGLIAEVNASRAHGNAVRHRRYFDEAMDLLEGVGALREWRYEVEDLEAIDRASRKERLSLWLNARIVFVLPTIERSMRALSVSQG